MKRAASWLELERLALGELPAELGQELDERSQALLRELRADVVALRPLPAAAGPAPRRWWLWSGGVGLAAATAAAALVLTLGGDERGAARVASVVGIKGGGTLAVELVRERAGSVALAPDRFAPGDRFKVLVTCSTPGQVTADVVVYQDGEASFPLAAGPVQCGNRTPLPGAFTLRGGPATVCVAVDPPERTALAAGPPRDAACAVVQPERQGPANQ